MRGQGQGRYSNCVLGRQYAFRRGLSMTIFATDHYLLVRGQQMQQMGVNCLFESVVEWPL